MVVAARQVRGEVDSNVEWLVDPDSKRAQLGRRQMGLIDYQIVSRSIDGELEAYRGVVCGCDRCRNNCYASARWDRIFDGSPVLVADAHRLDFDWPVAAIPNAFDRARDVRMNDVRGE